MRCPICNEIIGASIAEIMKAHIAAEHPAPDPDASPPDAAGIPGPEFGPEGEELIHEPESHPLLGEPCIIPDSYGLWVDGIPDMDALIMHLQRAHDLALKAQRTGLPNAAQAAALIAPIDELIARASASIGREAVHVETGLAHITNALHLAVDQCWGFNYALEQGSPYTGAPVEQMIEVDLLRHAIETVLIYGLRLAYGAPDC